jgi:hypothetical protein
MAASLRPAVSGASAKPIRRVTALHGAGLISGAVIMGLFFSLLGLLLVTAGLRSVMIVLVGIAIALAVMQSIGLSLPQSRWQVPEYWRRTLDASAVPVLYGAILGAGVFTAVVVGAFWVFAAITLRYSAPIAVIGWSSYALGRLTGFRLALQVRQLERIFLTAFQRRALIIATTIAAAVVAFI